MAPVELFGAHVSVNLFTVLGVEAARGRTFRPEDSQLTNVSPLVVSERLVRSGLVSGRLGDIVEFEGFSYRLIGTMPDTFWFPDRRTSFWAPILIVPREQLAPPGLSETGTFSISSRTVARLRAGVAPVAAQTQVNVRLALPGDRPGRVRYRVESHAALLSAPVRPALIALQAGSGLVLLLVCLNVGWLFAARGRRLRPTLATVRALGATTGQVLVTHLASAVCIVAVAAPCAVVIAWGLLELSLGLEGEVFSSTAAPAITAHVAWVAFVVTLLVGVASCVPGAVAVARSPGTLHNRTRAAARGRSDRSLMVVQASLVFALGAQAVLVALVLQSLVRTNVGFTKTDFLVIKLQPRGAATIDTRAFSWRATKPCSVTWSARASGPRPPTLFRSRELTTALTTSELSSPAVHARQVRTMARLKIVTPSYFPVTGLTATRGTGAHGGRCGISSRCGQRCLSRVGAPECEPSSADG